MRDPCLKCGAPAMPGRETCRAHTIAYPDETHGPHQGRDETYLNSWLATDQNREVS